MFVSRDGERSCLLRNCKGEIVYACVRIRFKGKNSVREQGFGMTILEKLERQGLIDLIECWNLGRLVGKRKRGRLSRK